MDEKPRHRRSFHSPRLSESAESDFSFWSGTGDLAEQLANEEDPLRIKLRDSSDGRILSDPSAPCDRQFKRVRYKEDGGAELKGIHGGLDKEDIEIPTPRVKPVSKSERILAAIMTGGNRRTQFHGLTGKPLL